jgi:hypothetical protein
MRIARAAICGIALSWFAAAQGDSLFTTPIISVKPRQIDFGSVPLKGTATNRFVVENWGGGKLVGKARVPKPFKILSGGNYRLSSGDAQVVTILYSPSGELVDTNVVTFTGGGGMLAPVSGKTAAKRE